MSGIYIPGMEMPTKGDYHMTLYVCGDGAAYVDVAELPADEDRFAAVPVPPHGDLIDRYALKNKEITIDYDEWDDTFDDGLLFVADLIDNAPAVIEAEGEE